MQVKNSTNMSVNMILLDKKITYIDWLIHEFTNKKID